MTHWPFYSNCVMPRDRMFGWGHCCHWNISSKIDTTLWKRKVWRWEVNPQPLVGMADSKLIRYATRTVALKWLTDRFIWTMLCETVQCNKFWNKKIRGWFCSYFLFLGLILMTIKSILRDHFFSISTEYWDSLVKVKFSAFWWWLCRFFYSCILERLFQSLKTP